MLHVLRFGARPVPDKVMRSMFAARKAVFVDLLKWDVPVLDGQFEVDQFDNEHAQYVVLADADGRHLGSARLLPTERPHIRHVPAPRSPAKLPPLGQNSSSRSRPRHPVAADRVEG